MHDQLVNELTAPRVFEDEADQAVKELVKREAWAKGFEIALLHAAVFNSELGQKLLALWIKSYYLFPIVRPGEDTKADGIREGRAEVVRHILLQLEIARRGQPGG